ncbi:hypothetical protein M405DRAFT_863967 [Rhizopogon salebrosus TDB-379]|nr:hypothetical protein M405DRAFT_863967 [Rhizopogon salebrosus TDB-379]
MSDRDQCLYFHLSFTLIRYLTLVTTSGDARLVPSTWKELSKVAAKGAEYDSPERRPHPKCLERTRVNLLGDIRGLLDNEKQSRLIWLHGTAGIGKSAVAFSVADIMRCQTLSETCTSEKRLAGTFFFSRKYEKRCTTGYLFATLVYQLATNFPSIRNDVNIAIGEDCAHLYPEQPLRKQMEALFIRPLRTLRWRLSGSPPVVFVIDALDECACEYETAELISLLGHALCDPTLPAVHILLTSRSEPHIHEAMHKGNMLTLVHEILLDDADVGRDIYNFLQHSFTNLKLQSRYSNFPRPTEDELDQLTNRAGKRFIVASTMMKFIDDRRNYPSDRLKLMLELTNKLLPDTEVYDFYNRILSTCAFPKRAYLHLSVVAALANPLPISQISELVEDNDVEKTLVELQSLIDIPTATNLPVKIYHSSVRDYVLNSSNFRLFEEQSHTPTPTSPSPSPSPHSLLAYSSFRFMTCRLPKGTGLLDALLEWKAQSTAMKPHPHQSLRQSLDFMVNPPTAMGVLTVLLWLREDRSPQLQSWLETPDGPAWLCTQGGTEWLQTQGGKDWLQTADIQTWLECSGGHSWLSTQGGSDWLQLPNGRNWLQSPTGKDWLRSPSCNMWSYIVGLEMSSSEMSNIVASDEHLPFWQCWLASPDGQICLLTRAGREWLQTADGRTWLQTSGRREWLQTSDGREWLRSSGGREWLQISGGREWLKTTGGREWLTTGGRWWLQILDGREWLQILDGRGWLQSLGGREWLQASDGQEWLRIPDGQEWLWTPDGRKWLHAPDGREWLQTSGARSWLQTQLGREWLQTPGGQDWLQTLTGKDWLQVQVGQDWLQTQGGRDWLQTEGGRNWLQIPGGRNWLQTSGGRDWLQTPGGLEWLQTSGGRGWLHTSGGQEWLKASDGREWLQTPGGREWLQTLGGREWLKTLDGREWLKTSDGREWLHILDGREWLQTSDGRDWLQRSGGQEWLQTQSAREWLNTSDGRDWLHTLDGREWLRTPAGREWLQIPAGREWLQTRSGREWLQTPHGQAWRLSPAAYFWVHMEEFLNTVKAINEFIIIEGLSSLPPFRAIQEFKSLPDFLMFPAFLALTFQTPAPALAQGPDIDLIHAMKAFVAFTNKAQERSRSASDTLTYACQNWAMHLSRALHPWDDRLGHIFKVFWDDYLLSWLERQWCSSGLRPCLDVLSIGQTLAKEYLGRLNQQHVAP